MVKRTPTKRRAPKKPLRGAIDGKPFTKENQPTPEQKKAGWEQWRRDRHLTQAVIKAMLGNDGVPTTGFNGYITALIKNAKKGNPKAIDTINKCLEDDIIKVAQTDTEGNDVVSITKVEIVRPITDGE